MQKIRILQILRGSGSFGGVTNFIVSRYALMNRDLYEYTFLFCQRECVSGSGFSGLISENNIFELKALKEKNGFREYQKLYSSLLKFLLDKQFDCVHINTGSVPITYICLKACKKVSAQNLIVHSHSSNYLNGALNTVSVLKPLKHYLQWCIYNNSDYHFACSKMAAQNMFGNRNYELICNAIDIDKFAYNEETRNIIRIKYGVENSKVYGFVGRLSKSKNINFAIEVFKKILYKYPESTFWIIGDGEEREEIKKLIKDNGLNKKIVMFGNRNDVNELMQAMDSFLFPSLYEGLSLTVIEAQVSGLPVYLSDTLSNEHKLTNLVQFLPLKRGASYWAETIINDNSVERIDNANAIREQGYGLRDSVKWFENFYSSLH